MKSEKKWKGTKIIESFRILEVNSNFRGHFWKDKITPSKFAWSFIYQQLLYMCHLKSLKFRIFQTVTSKTWLMENATSKFILPGDVFLNKGLVDNKPVVFSYLKGREEVE